jgi:hypothetical protein
VLWIEDSQQPRRVSQKQEASVRILSEIIHPRVRRQHVRRRPIAPGICPLLRIDPFRKLCTEPAELYQFLHVGEISQAVRSGHSRS